MALLRRFVIFASQPPVNKQKGNKCEAYFGGKKTIWRIFNEKLQSCEFLKKKIQKRQKMPNTSCWKFSSTCSKLPDIYTI